VRLPSFHPAPSLPIGSLGKVDPGTVKGSHKEVTAEEAARLERVKNRPPLDEILNLHDFEVQEICLPHPDD